MKQAPCSLDRRRKSIGVTSSQPRLLSLEEAQERAQINANMRQTYIDVGGGPSALPLKYHTVIDLPKGLVHLMLLVLVDDEYSSVYLLYVWLNVIYRDGLNWVDVTFDNRFCLPLCNMIGQMDKIYSEQNNNNINNNKNNHK